MMIRSNHRYSLPSTSALAAFESAARHCNFSRAADELQTSQPAVSRHVAGIEGLLGTVLFERTGNRVALTDDGRRLYHAVVAGFEEIGRAVDELKRAPRRRQVSIACSYDVAHLWLMPRHEGLQAHLGDDVEIRVVASEYERQDLDVNDDVDLYLTFLNPLLPGLDSVLLFEEEVFPVCAPAFLDDHAAAFAAAGTLARLPLLTLSKRNFGWATWNTWLRHEGIDEDAEAGQRRFSSYVYLLEAASDGAGVALGWRGLVERYLEQGRLVRPFEGGVRSDGAFRAVLSRRGRSHDLGDRVLSYLSRA